MTTMASRLIAVPVTLSVLGGGAAAVLTGVWAAVSPHCCIEGSTVPAPLPEAWSPVGAV